MNSPKRDKGVTAYNAIIPFVNTNRYILASPSSFNEQNWLSNKGMVVSDTRVTTTKTRIISGDQQMLRVDEEQTDNIQVPEENALISTISTIVEENKIDVIILEDYNKGVLTEKIISSVIELANAKNIPTTVDPKLKNFFSYKGVTLFKPNLKEIEEGLNISVNPEELSSLEQASHLLKKQLSNSITLITLSEHGVFVNDSGNSKCIPAHIRDIFDVSGAGDTVISVASLCLAKKTNVAFMAALANLSGGQVCEKIGVVPIDKAQLLTEAESLL